MSCRQPLVFLKEAEEIRVNYNDIDRLRDFVTEDWTCTADVVIHISKNQLVDWDNINSYKDTLNIIIAVENTSQIPEVKEKGYKVYWEYPVSNYWELRSILHLGVDQVLLDGPLCFNLYKVKAICGENVELRMVVNKCFNNNLPQENGICGPYVRPEDIDLYSTFVDHFEFDSDNSIKKEYTLYKIYTKDKNWPGNLNLLLTNLNVDVDNRGFEVLPLEDEADEQQENKTFATRRMQCGQVCQGTSSCRLCEKYFNLINVIQKKAEQQKLKELKESQQ